MRNYIFFILVISLSGCVSPYAYQSISNSDPEIIFGERMGDVGTRGFNVKVSDSPTNNCKDFMNIGSVANSSKMFDKVKTIKTPEGKAVTIRGILGASGAMCVPSAKLFKPESGNKYSVDIGLVNNKCFLSIAKIDSSGRLEEVKDITTLPECNF